MALDLTERGKAASDPGFLAKMLGAVFVNAGFILNTDLGDTDLSKARIIWAQSVLVRESPPGYAEATTNRIARYSVGTNGVFDQIGDVLEVTDPQAQGMVETVTENLALLLSLENSTVQP